MLQFTRCVCQILVEEDSDELLTDQESYSTSNAGTISHEFGVIAGVFAIIPPSVLLLCSVLRAMPTLSWTACCCQGVSCTPYLGKWLGRKWSQ